jgi:putative transferase (TIGR04331 family)
MSTEILANRRLAYARSYSGSSDVEGELRRAIALSAPLDVVEQHHELADWARSSADEGIKVCYSANAHQASTGYRHHLYEQRHLKSKIVFHQHGGGNGIDELHPGEFHDTTIGDIFYSWGWTREDLGRRIRPLSPALPAHRRSTPESKYLLMSLPATAHFYRLQPFLIPYHIERAIAETTSFASSLEESIQLRLRSSGASAFPLARLENVRASVTVDDLSEPGAMAASRARLVIHNYLGTTWLETLALNVPTVCFYDPRLYEPRESARPYFDMLARVGVLHHSGRDAAKFVNDLHGDPSSWWNSAEVQEAREAFVARYANFSDNWLEAWQTEFESLLAE